MSTLNKYIVYKCSVCKRETEILLDARRPDPVRCNITLHCRGTLSRVGERTTKDFLFTPLVAGLDDYVPRGQEVSIVPMTAPPNPISIFTGQGVMTIAAFHRDVDPLSRQVTFWITDIDGARLNVETPSTFNAPSPLNASVVLTLFEITPELLKFKKYVYNVDSGTQLIYGVDDSPEGLNLRFDGTNKIKVFLNGVALSEDRYDRTVDNQLTMTPSITVQNSIVEVLVWDIIPETQIGDTVELNFVPLGSSQTDLSYRDMVCWGDYSAVDFSGIYSYEGQRTLLYCLDTSELNVAKTYGVSKYEAVLANGNRVQLSPSELYVMLGREPFMFQDKELNAFVLGVKFFDPSTMLSFQQSTASGSYQIMIDQTIITQKYNPLVPVIPVSNTVSDAAVSQTVQTTEDLKRKYILGPS